jgi:hypothetical protein
MTATVRATEHCSSSNADHFIRSSKSLHPSIVPF